jgi:hypothetical protein
MAAKKNPRKIGANGEAKRVAFLAAIGKGLSITEASGVSGLNRNTAGRLRKQDKEFAAAYDQAIAEGRHYLAAEATRRAVEGTEKPALHQGREVYTLNRETGELQPLRLREYSDVLLMFLMKARDPMRYDDRIRAMKFERRWRKRDGEGDGDAVAPADVIDMLAKLASQKAKEAA